MVEKYNGYVLFGTARVTGSCWLVRLVRCRNGKIRDKEAR